MPKTQVAPSCKAVLTQANELFPGRSKATDGLIGDADHRTRDSDHNPNANGWVHAADLTHDPAHGIDAHAWIRAVAARRDPRVKYLISNREICYSTPVNGRAAWEWQPYKRKNPHISHVHVSIHHTDEARNDTSSWFEDDPANPEEAKMEFPETQTTMVPGRGPRPADNRWSMWGWRPNGDVFCWNFAPDMSQRVPTADEKDTITEGGKFQVIGLHPRPDGEFGYVLVTNHSDDQGGLCTFTF